MVWSWVKEARIEILRQETARNTGWEEGHFHFLAVWLEVNLYFRLGLGVGKGLLNPLTMGSRPCPSRWETSHSPRAAQLSQRLILLSCLHSCPESCPVLTPVLWRVFMVYSFVFFKCKPSASILMQLSA